MDDVKRIITSRYQFIVTMGLFILTCYTMNNELNDLHEKTRYLEALILKKIVQLEDKDHYLDKRIDKIYKKVFSTEEQNTNNIALQGSNN